uniref:Uncharacterized protein n=1 Tax=Steinernema glaseri TaxID=37863 RepID=A0A1I7YVY1_9BILA
MQRLRRPNGEKEEEARPSQADSEPERVVLLRAVASRTYRMDFYDLRGEIEGIKAVQKVTRKCPEWMRSSLSFAKKWRLAKKKLPVTGKNGTEFKTDGGRDTL